MGLIVACLPNDGEVSDVPNDKYHYKHRDPGMGTQKHARGAPPGNRLVDLPEIAQPRPTTADRGTMSTILSHAGGLDEIALIAAPLLGVGGLLWAANRWAKKRAQSD
jgi:hypothetical protein